MVWLFIKYFIHIRKNRFKNIAWIWSYHLPWKFKIWAGKGVKANFEYKKFVDNASNVLPLRLKQTFPSRIWIFTDGEGYEIESRHPFRIFSTLCIWLKANSKGMSIFSVKLADVHKVQKWEKTEPRTIRPWTPLRTTVLKWPINPVRNNYKECHY